MVYADIGTSIDHVPGLLFDELGGRTPSPAAAFELGTGLALLLLARGVGAPPGRRWDRVGGHRRVRAHARLGGILICISSFLTGAISAVSGVQYLAGSWPGRRLPAA